MLEDFRFKVVSEEVWEKPVTRKTGVRINSPIFKELEQGKTLFVTGTTDKELNGFYEAARSIGKKLSIRKTILNEESGYALRLLEREEG